jgi:hypothetical protein
MKWKRVSSVPRGEGTHGGQARMWGEPEGGATTGGREKGQAPGWGAPLGGNHGVKVPGGPCRQGDTRHSGKG